MGKHYRRTTNVIDFVDDLMSEEPLEMLIKYGNEFACKLAFTYRSMHMKREISHNSVVVDV